MAVDSLVDGSLLNSNLASIANALRNKVGGSLSYSFPTGFVSAIEALPNCVTFRNYDNSQLDIQYVANGSNALEPISAGRISTPVRPAIEGESYIYTGWSGSYISVNSGRNIIATFSHALRIRYLNGESVLLSSYYSEGTFPSYTGETPSRAETEEVAYEFRKWTPSVVSATVPADYSAVFGTNIKNSPGAAYLTAASSFSSYSNSYMYTVQSYAFAGLPYLTSVSLPVCSSIGEGAFELCDRLESIVLTTCKYVGWWAFSGCQSLKNVNLATNAALQITNYVFIDCAALSSITLYCTSMGYSNFLNCTALKSISLPNCTSMAGSNFYGCTELLSISFSKLQSIGGHEFDGCTKLKNVSLPLCYSLDLYAFMNCTALSSVILPKCVSIPHGAFSKCTSLSYVELPNCKTISGYAFADCSTLTLKVGMSLSSICSINGYGAFWGTSIKSIYVPSSLANLYKAASYWKAYSNCIIGI